MTAAVEKRLRVWCFGLVFCTALTTRIRGATNVRLGSTIFGSR
jgi:hypothetical protein